MIRRHRVRALALAAALLAGCSGDDSDATAFGPVPTAPPTTTTSTVASTTTVTPSTSTTRPGVTSTRLTTIGTPTTAGAPPPAGGTPQATTSPAGAPVGAWVRIEGTGFADEVWRASGATLWLAGGTTCDLYAQAEHTIAVSPAGRLAGEFRVPAMGNCRMTSLGERPVPTGSYRIVFACTACTIGTFEVTLPPDHCVDVAFAPNSDNLASDIVASGLSCLDAEALVRKVGAQVRAVGGPSRVEVDGFVCIRTAETDRGLPSSDFECTSGSKRVNFHRT